MKNLISTVALLLLFISVSLAQNKDRRKVKVNDNGYKIELEIEDGDITKFKINGKKIAEKDYSKHDKIIAKYSKNIVSIDDFGDEEDIEKDEEKDESTRLHQGFLEELVEDEIVNAYYKYKIELNNDKLVVNGDRLSKDLLKKYTRMYEQLTGYVMTPDTEVEIEKKGGNKRVSITR